MNKIPVAGPLIGEKELEYVTDAVKTAWYADSEKYHKKLEAAFSEYVGRKYAVALPSCTAAIHLGLLALGVKPGDEVLVPDLTWIASSAPISYVGATPVFVDVDPQSWCLSAEAVSAKITERSKAIIAVDLYGNMPDMSALEEISRKHGIPLLEDAAEAVGSVLKGRKAGNFGDLSVFSFHGSKTLTSGEGGMLVTDSEDIYSRVRFLMDHGRTPGDVAFNNLEVAYKYKMSSMQAALALAQLERIDELVEKKRQIFNWYSEGLEGIPGLVLNPDIPDLDNSYWMSTVVLDSKFKLGKHELKAMLAQAGIDSRPMFSPLSSLPAYKDLESARLAARENSSAYEIGPHGLNLPSALILGSSEVERVSAALRDILAV